MSRSYDLPKHIKNVHEGQRDHKCEYCEKKYTEKKHLLTHIKRVHDNIRDEHCNQCGKLFFTKEVLKRHIRNMHKHSKDETSPTNSNLMEHKNVKNPDLNMKHSNNIEHGTTTKNSLCSICGEEFTQVRMIFIMKSCSILKKTKAAWIENIDITSASFSNDQNSYRYEI